MTALDSDVGSQPWFEPMARIGLSARAFVYFAVSALALWGAYAGYGDGASPTDAFREIENQAWGAAALLTLAAGLAMYSVWRFLQAAFDTGGEGDDAKGWLARVGMVSSSISYLLIAAASFSIARSGGSGGGSSTRGTVRALLDMPAGPLIVILAGLALAGVGGAQIWRAHEGEWKKSLALRGWGRDLETPAGWAIAGRGVLFILAGLSVAYAGVTADPGNALGLASTLGYLREQPFGLVLYAAAALAVGGYGAYCVLQAKFTRF